MQVFIPAKGSVVVGPSAVAERGVSFRFADSAHVLRRRSFVAAAAVAAPVVTVVLPEGSSPMSLPRLPFPP